MAWNPNLPIEWFTDGRISELRPGAYRVLCNSLMWSVLHNTDGSIPASAWRFIATPGVEASDLAELIDSGVAEPEPETAGGFRLIGWGDALGQPTAEQRARKTATARANGSMHKPAATDVGSNVGSDVATNVQIRSEQMREENPHPVTDWPTAPIPGGDES